jgi:tetratricopeptide (TPR) repeat protein
MWTSLRRLFGESFLPLLLVLLGVIGGTLCLDRLAREVAVRPKRIAVVPTMGDWSESELSDDGLASPRGAAQTDTADARADLVPIRRLSRAGDHAQALANVLRLLEAAPTDPVLRNEAAVLELRLGRAAEAASRLEALVAERPEFHRGWYNLGVAWTQAKRPTDARRAYERALALRPNHLESHVNLGMLQLDAGETASAVTTLEKATEIGGGDERARAYFSYGVALGRAGRPEDAMVAYTKAIEFRPDYLLPRYNQAQLIMARRTPEALDEAERILRQTLALGPDFAPAWFLLGRLASERDRDEEALEYYAAASRAAPRFFKAAYNAALVALRLKRLDDAMRGFERLVVDFPERPEPHFNLGRIAYLRRKHEEALRAYRRAIELADGKYPEAELNLALTLRASGQKEAALGVLDALLVRQPEMVSAQQNRALVLMSLDRDDEARAALLRVVDAPSPTATAYFNLGVLEAKQGRHAKAAAAYEKALLLEEDHLKAAINLGIAKAALGDRDAAVRAHERATAIAPDYVPAWLNLGIALKKADRPGEAADAYRRALVLDPENVKALTNLGAVYARQGLFDLAIRADLDALEIAPRNAAARYNLALAYKRAGRVDDALAELAKARTLSPNHARTANLLATIHIERGEWQAAIEALSRFESSPKARASHLRTLARARLGLGELGAAEALYTRVAQRAPADPETVKLGARIALARGDRAGARRQLEGLAGGPADAELFELRKSVEAP